MAPTTVGIAAAAKAMTDEGLCDTVKVSGLGLPDEMRAYTESGCAPQFALWSFVDLGYLTYYATYGIATGADRGDRGPDVHGRPARRVHDRDGPDPRRRARGSSWARSPSTTRRTSTRDASAGRGGSTTPRPAAVVGPHAADEEDERVHRVGFTLQVRPEMARRLPPAPRRGVARHARRPAPGRLAQLLAVPAATTGRCSATSRRRARSAEAQAAMAAEPVNERWQALMAAVLRGRRAGRRPDDASSSTWSSTWTDTRGGDVGRNLAIRGRRPAGALARPRRRPAGHQLRRRQHVVQGRRSSTRSPASRSRCCA